MSDIDNAAHIRLVHEQIEGLWQTLEHYSTAEEHRARAREFRQRADQAEAHVKALRSDLQSMLKATHDESTKYFNVVSVVGYASYFATWSFTKDILNAETASFVGFMGMISVSLFVLWEMWMIMAVRMKTISELNHVLRNTISREDFEVLKADLERNEARRIAIITPMHRLVFSASLLTATAGGATMMHALFLSL